MIVALAMIAVGGGAIAWRMGAHPVDEWIDRVDQTAFSRAVEQQWWIWVLIATTVIALGWGVLLLSTNIAPRAVDDVRLAGSDEAGTLTIAPKLIASAVADELEGNPLFQKVSAKAIDDRARRIIRVVVTARPNRTYAEICGPVDRATDSIVAALGESDVHVQGFIHLEK
ncbi:alkaline shock response membrane anchor protein AmaP [Gordonia paraffinivorans]|nr:alkaline shock response membrane anchor protein AmaP [Gordonia paraffinivorans]MCD2143989.1 alkaline shock response membrane anchor protein AmaP [Gordonia paraffinivorans]